VVVVPVVVVPVVVVPVVDVPVVDDVDCTIAAGLVPATTAAANPPTASIAHAASAVPRRLMRVEPPCLGVIASAAGPGDSLTL
jgi:hypothetical protein